VLTIAREDAGEMPDGEVSLEELAREAAAADPALVVEAGGPGLVRGDRGSLERALRNLVENARAYGPPGGLVRIGVETAPGTVVLSVTDEGAGIPPELADAATARFWRGANADGSDGSGLGLSLVRAAAERHGGRLAIAGPRFAIELPALMPLSGPPGHHAGASPRRHQ
jgi:signal transduction histidine kinase